MKAIFKVQPNIGKILHKPKSNWQARSVPIYYVESIKNQRNFCKNRRIQNTQKKNKHKLFLTLILIHSNKSPTVRILQ